MYCTLLLLYLFKCTSDKSCIQSGQGLSQSYYANTGVFNILFYSHLLTSRCYCCCCYYCWEITASTRNGEIQTVNQTTVKVLLLI